MSARAVAVLVALHVGLAACSGTETGNPAGAQVAFGVRASDPAVVTVGAGGTGHRVDALLLAVEEAALLGCLSDSGATPVFEGAAVIDLAQGALGDARVPAGEYCGVRVTLAPRSLPAVGQAPAIDGASVAAHGVRADGVPFTVASRMPLTVVAQGEPFAVHDGEDFVLAFDVSPWLGGGILEGAAVVEGRATIDGLGDSAVQFEQQITVGLHRDLDADGAVGADEMMPVVAADGPDVSP